MYCINKVFITPAFVPKDVELRYGKSGQPYAFFDIGFDDSYKPTGGEIVEKTSYVRCQLWGKIAEALTPFLKKGTKVSIFGKLRITSRKNEGSKYPIKETSIMVSDIILIGSSKKVATTDGGYSKTDNKEIDVPAEEEEFDDSPPSGEEPPF